MKKIVPFLCLLLAITACNKLDEQVGPGTYGSAFTTNFEYPEIEIQALDGRAPLDGQAVFQLAERLGGGQLSEFHWSMTDDYTLWSAIVAGDSTVSLGYKPADAGDTWEKLGDLNLTSKRWRDARAYTIGFILKELNQLSPGQVFTEEDLKIESPESLPLMWLRIPAYEVIAKLRQLETVRYVEPSGYEPEQFMNDVATRFGPDGCGGNSAYTPGEGLSDFSSTYTSSKVSWHLEAHRIREAWASSQGDNVTIGLLDTGISHGQTLLKSPEFIWGPSSGRTIISSWTYKGPYPWSNQNDSDDRCGHGTNRAGALVGPVNNDDAITGIAYKANLHSVRVSNDVFINTSKTRTAFAQGMTSLANNSSVKVISISLGRLTDKSDVKDAVNYASNTKQKLVVCAAGTATGVYPAKYTNTTAVTAVEYRPNTDPNGTNLKVDGINVKASFVDFSSYIRDTEAYSSNVKAYGMQEVSKAPRSSVGTSTAAPIVAGIAALVWAAKPTLSKSQVIQILRDAASYSYDNSNFGYGVIDAEEAVSLATAGCQQQLSVTINGASYITSSGFQNWTGQFSNICGNINSYKWYWNGTLVSSSSNYANYIMTNGSYTNNTLKLVVTTSGGQTAQYTKAVIVI